MKLLPCLQRAYLLAHNPNLYRLLPRPLSVSPTATTALLASRIKCPAGVVVSWTVWVDDGEMVMLWLLDWKLIVLKSNSNFFALFSYTADGFAQSIIMTYQILCLTHPQELNIVFILSSYQQRRRSSSTVK